MCVVSTGFCVVATGSVWLHLVCRFVSCRLYVVSIGYVSVQLVRAVFTLFYVILVIAYFIYHFMCVFKSK